MAISFGNNIAGASKGAFAILSVTDSVGGASFDILDGDIVTGAVTAVSGAVPLTPIQLTALSSIFKGLVSIGTPAANELEYLRKLVGVLPLKSGDTVTLSAANVGGNVWRLSGSLAVAGTAFVYVPNTAAAGPFTGDGASSGSSAPPGGPAGGVLGYPGSTYPNPNGLAGIADTIPVKAPAGATLTVAVDSGPVGKALRLRSGPGIAGAGGAAELSAGGSIAGNGGNVLLTPGGSSAGDAGDAVVQGVPGAPGAAGVSVGGDGSSVIINTGIGGVAADAGTITAAAGNGGTADDVLAVPGGLGGDISLAAGDGGAGSPAQLGGRGGDVSIVAGDAGADNGGGTDRPGDVNITSSGLNGLGLVGTIRLNSGIGTSAPQGRVEVGESTKPGHVARINCQLSLRAKSRAVTLATQPLIAESGVVRLNSTIGPVTMIGNPRIAQPEFLGTIVTFVNIDDPITIAGSLSNPAGANIQTPGGCDRLLEPGASITLVSIGTNNWVEVDYTPANLAATQTPLAATSIKPTHSTLIFNNAGAVDLAGALPEIDVTGVAPGFELTCVQGGAGTTKFNPDAGGPDTLLLLPGGAAVTLAGGDSITFVYDGTFWVTKSYSNN